MGWTGGTEIFDAVVGALLDKKSKKEDIIVSLIEALEDQDWDTQDDSSYYDDPDIAPIFESIHPEWFGDA